MWMLLIVGLGLTMVGLVAFGPRGSPTEGRTSPTERVDAARAERTARQRLRAELLAPMPTDTADRVTAEVSRARNGWAVVLRDVNVPCPQLSRPGMCGGSPPRPSPEASMPAPMPTPHTFRDVLYCIDAASWSLTGGSASTSPRPLDNVEPCGRLR